MNQIARNFPRAEAALEPGLYFGLSEDRYHADIALGSGSIRALAKHPIYYWKDSWMNPLREPEQETEALLFGRAIHKIVLEGLDAFHGAYAPHPLKSDHPLAFDTATQIKARLKELGQKQTGAKAELIQRLKLADPEAVFWEDIESGFEAACRRDGKTPLKRKVYEAVIAAASFIAQDERVAPAFHGGVSEVSVVVEIEGVRLKARLDKLRLGMEGSKLVGLIVDLKSFANIAEQAPEKAIATAIANTDLPVQAAAYLEVASHIPALIAAGKVHGDCDPAFLAQLAKLGPQDFRWFWCFFEKGAPVNLLRTPAQDVLDVGRSKLSAALQGFREHMERFGTAWRFVDPIPDITVTMQDLPVWWGR